MSNSTLNVCCPPPTSLESAITTLNACSSDVGQIQKLIFWRRGNSIASVATALIEATWTALFIATDDTKAIVSPFVANVDLPMGDPREFGGGNETRWGSPKRKGASTALFSARMYQVDQDVITTLKQLACEPLDVLFVNESNQLIYNLSASSEVEGFEVIALNVTKLRSDNMDPREYLDRLAEWRGRVEKTGGHWKVINDLDGLDGLL